MTTDAELAELAGVVIAAARHTGCTLGTAESLTGGGVANALTGVPGASTVVLGGIISYASAVKAAVLGVPAALLAERGAVDGEVAAAMARGAREVLGCDLAVATTGVAGPDPCDGKPVGTVFVAVADGVEVRIEELRLSGSRADIRSDSVAGALRLLGLAFDTGTLLRSAPDPGEYLSHTSETMDKEWS